ncbi:hypothetical protein Nepgr_022093 [Nepenthes gracilis]|uniref:CRIB domain-containing protein n=1 Tax=Nepenthes gracilis TaxID=150966 RepID=A0AAD3T162_NEPGR|nr:hypothetical protein Nepgr_022093 [Nepenthes gracilis]
MATISDLFKFEDSNSCQIVSSSCLMVCEGMKGRIKRQIFLPFSMGCASESSVVVGRQEEGKRSSCTNMTSSFAFLALPKPNISCGSRLLIKRFKSLSQLFVYKDEVDEEEMEMTMEIGFPTDVKHLTHIGWDGSIKGCEDLSTSEIISFPSISVSQFEIAMAAQSDASDPQLLVNC